MLLGITITIVLLLSDVAILGVALGIALAVYAIHDRSTKANAAAITTAVSAALADRGERLYTDDELV
jgi:hypothetical protein